MQLRGIRCRVKARAQGGVLVVTYQAPQFGADIHVQLDRNRGNGYIRLTNSRSQELKDFGLHERHKILWASSQTSSLVNNNLIRTSFYALLTSCYERALRR
jgi:hypothetical protein